MILFYHYLINILEKQTNIIKIWVFFNNGKKLKQYNMTLDQGGIGNLGKIIVEEHNQIIGGGGFCLNFTDLSKQI